MGADRGRGESGRTEIEAADLAGTRHMARQGSPA